MLFDGPPFNAGGHGVNQTSGYGCWSPMQIREVSGILCRARRASDRAGMKEVEMANRGKSAAMPGVQKTKIAPPHLNVFCSDAPRFFRC